MNPIREHRNKIKKKALSLCKEDVFNWLVQFGYYPEGYVLPPCFRVVNYAIKTKPYFNFNNRKNIHTKQLISVHYPKSEFTDRDFGIMDPVLHHDIAYHISENWEQIVERMMPTSSDITSYSFPVPLNVSKIVKQGVLANLRGGRMIYQFLDLEDELATIAYKYNIIIRTDIRNYYPSIYTHSIAWAIDGKDKIRKNNNRFDYKYLGNKLDLLFRNANDQCTNGIPIGPVISDIIAEIVLSAVDEVITKMVKKQGIKCEMARFKDDYKILVESKEKAYAIIKIMQAALKEYNLTIGEDKTSIDELPEGLFRKWVSQYHLVHPKKRNSYTWKEFRELYLAVMKIDQEYPGGVIDRFLADMVSKNGNLKVHIRLSNLQKIISMLFMLATRRIKTFPKVLAIIESIIRTPFGLKNKNDIIMYLQEYLDNLTVNEERNKYLITWILYFLQSNNLMQHTSISPTLNDPITCSVYNNRGRIFKDNKDFKLYEGCRAAGNRITLLEHLKVFESEITN